MSVAIVTGADSGIGRASAIALAEAGHDVGFTWLEDPEGANSAAAEIRAHGVRAALRESDFSDPRSGPAALAELAGELGGVDVLVNNAAVGAMAPFLDVAIEQWQRVLDVNLTAPLLISQAAAKLMVAAGRGGRIVNVTSVHEQIPLPGGTAYCAAKGGLGLLTKVMALELAEHGITVNAVAPGEIATPMNDADDIDPHTLERPGIPAGRPGAAAEVAAVIAFLASPEARYVTGASYVVDGGLTLMAAVRNLESA